jgi:Mrp family chromosome partitioning ATPase
MKFLRAEEGEEPTPTIIRPVVQIVPSSPPPTNGQKRKPAHVAPGPARAAAAPAAAPAHAPDDEADTNATGTNGTSTNGTATNGTAPPRTVTNGTALARTPTNGTALARTATNGTAANGTAPSRTPAHAVSARSVPQVVPASTPTHAAAAIERQSRDIVSSRRRSTPSIPAEVLDACVVALRRMGGSNLQSIGVTSSVKGEGRSTIAAAMAVIQSSEYQRKTILVELDGHRPSAARELGLAETPGVAEFVRDDLDIEDCIQWVTDDLGVVVAGADPSMAKLLGGSAADRLVSALARRSDVLVLDLPSLEKGSGGVQFVGLCEAVALVVRAGEVSRHRIEEAAAKMSTPPFVILNGVKSATPRWVRRLLGMH